jgi:hypothetical protein
MSTTQEPASIELYLADIYAHLVRELGQASNAARFGLRGYGQTWAAFAATLRAWLRRERDVLFPAIDRALPACTDRGRLGLEHEALERSLQRAGAQVAYGGREELVETAQAALFILYRHGVRARRRYGAQLDRVLADADRAALLAALPAPDDAAALSPCAPSWVTAAS